MAVKKKAAKKATKKKAAKKAAKKATKKKVAKKKAAPIKKRRVKKQKPHYVDNALFLQQMIDWRNETRQAVAVGLNRPRVPEAVGEAFMKIATHLSYKPNFINYPFRDEMISDGVENCLQYIDNFDPAKSHNPFAYFTQIIYYAFLRRIAKEKKQLYIRYRAIERSGIMDQLTRPEGQKGSSTEATLYDNMLDFIATFEENLAKQKEKAAESKRRNAKALADE